MIMNNELIKSEYLQIVREENHSVVYHSLFGYPQILNNDALELLNHFGEKTNIRTILGKKLYAQAGKNIEKFRKCFFLISPGFDEREHLRKVIKDRYLSVLQKGAAVEYLSLIVSEECNFACAYCISNSMIQASQRRYNNVKKMNFSTAKLAVDTFFSILHNNGKKKAYVNFGGGEPLLNFDVIKGVLNYIQDRYAHDFEINYTINTNASLITPNIANILKYHKVKIALSLDGLEQANDAVRKTKTGQGTFSIIRRAIQMLNDIDYNPGGFAATLTEKNFDMINVEELIEFAKENGFSEFRLDLDVIHMLKIPLKKATQKLLTIKRKAKEVGLEVTGFWERPVENLNDSILEKYISFCGGVAGKSMCVNPQGDIFVCGYSAKKIVDLGNINKTSIGSSYINLVTERAIGNIKRCRGCPIEGLCGGGCYVTEEFKNLKTRGALDYNCRLFRKMSTELLRDSLKEVIFAS